MRKNAKCCVPFCNAKAEAKLRNFSLTLRMTSQIRFFDCL